MGVGPHIVHGSSWIVHMVFLFIRHNLAEEKWLIFQEVEVFLFEASVLVSLFDSIQGLGCEDSHRVLRLEKPV